MAAIPPHPPKNASFVLTSCGHIFCTKCYTAPNIPCLVCKNKCMITLLKPNMSPDVQLFFMDPLEVAVKLHKQLLKVLDFQKSQRKRLTAYRINNIKKTQSSVNSMEQEIQKLSAENRQLKGYLSQAKENITPTYRPSSSSFIPPTPDTRSRVTPDHVIRSRGASPRHKYSNSFAQALGSRITPPPAIFQTPRSTPSPRSLEDCKRSVEYNSKRLYKQYSGGFSRT